MVMNYITISYIEILGKDIFYGIFSLVFIFTSTYIFYKIAT